MRKRHFGSVFRVLALFAALVPFNSGQSKAGQWNDIINHGFESSTPWPNGKWITYDCSYTSTQGIWATTFSKAYLSTKSVHPRAGTTPYNYNTCTWMRFGPFTLVGATNARMIFQYWLDSEVGYDVFRWEYSCNGVNAWTGRAASGNVGAWVNAQISLKPCVGRSQVYVQFTFVSDQSVNYQGVWVDNVNIQRFIP